MKGSGLSCTYVSSFLFVDTGHQREAAQRQGHQALRCPRVENSDRLRTPWNGISPRNQWEAS